jgi:hypothetical protein
LVRAEWLGCDKGEGHERLGASRVAAIRGLGGHWRLRVSHDVSARKVTN